MSCRYPPQALFVSHPRLVPPFQPISLNLTTTAESFAHYKALLMS